MMTLDDLASHASVWRGLCDGVSVDWRLAQDGRLQSVLDELFEQGSTARAEFVTVASEGGPIPRTGKKSSFEQNILRDLRYFGAVPRLLPDATVPATAPPAHAAVLFKPGGNVTIRVDGQNRHGSPETIATECSEATLRELHNAARLAVRKLDADEDYSAEHQRVGSMFGAGA